MSTLSQFFNSGADPKGSITTQLPNAAEPLLAYNGDYYAKTALTSGVTNPTSTSARTSILAKSSDFMLPVAQIALAPPQAASSRYSHSFAFGNSVYLRGTPQGLIRSTDGVTWSPVEISSVTGSNTLGTALNPYSKVVFGAGIFLTVVDAASGTTVVPGALVLASSTDGLAWTLSSIVTHYSGEPLSSSTLTIANAGLDFDGTNFWLSINQFDSTNSSGYILASKSIDGKNWTPVYRTSNSTYNPSNWKTVVGSSNNLVIATMAGYNNNGVNVSAYGTTTTPGGIVSIASGELLGQIKWLNSSQFVAVKGLVSSTAAVFTSPTGSTWTTRSLPTTALLADITFGNSTYVAVGDAGKIYTSSDAITWVAQTSGTSEQLVSVEWDSALSLFICVGVTTIRTSSNGTSWSAATIPAGLGTRSTLIPYAGSSTLLAKLNGTWFTTIGSADHVISSANGTTWTAAVVGGALSTSSAIAAGSTANAANNSLFKLNTLMIACPAAGGLMVAPIATNAWTLRVTAATGVFNSVTYGNNLYVAVGASGIVYTSPDGTTWTSRTSGTATNLTGISWSGNEFVAISSTVAIRSTDGTTWAAAGSNGGQRMCFSAGKFIVMANTDIRTSLDGVNWVTVALGQTVTQMMPFSEGAAIWGSVNYLWIVTRSGLRMVPTPSASTSSVTEIGDFLYLVSSSGFMILSAPRYESSAWQTISNSNAINGAIGTLYNGSGYTTNRYGIKIGANTYYISTGSNNVAGTYGMAMFIVEPSRLLSTAAVAYFDSANVWTSDESQGLSWAPKARATPLAPPTQTYAIGANTTSTLTAPIGTISYRKIT